MQTHANEHQTICDLPFADTLDARRLVNTLTRPFRPSLGARAAAGGPAMQNHNGHPLARSTSLVSSLDLVSSPEAELGKRKRLESRDGKRHRRMESAPVRSGVKNFSGTSGSGGCGRPPRPKRRHGLYTHPRTRSEPSPAPTGRKTK